MTEERDTPPPVESANWREYVAKVIDRTWGRVTQHDQRIHDLEEGLDALANRRGHDWGPDQILDLVSRLIAVRPAALDSLKEPEMEPELGLIITHKMCPECRYATPVNPNGGAVPDHAAYCSSPNPRLDVAMVPVDPPSTPG